MNFSFYFLANDELFHTKTLTASEFSFNSQDYYDYFSEIYNENDELNDSIHLETIVINDNNVSLTFDTPIAFVKHAQGAEYTCYHNSKYSISEYITNNLPEMNNNYFKFTNYYSTQQTIFSPEVVTCIDYNNELSLELGYTINTLYGDTNELCYTVDYNNNNTSKAFMYREINSNNNTFAFKVNEIEYTCKTPCGYFNKFQMLDNIIFEMNRYASGFIGINAGIFAIINNTNRTSFEFTSKSTGYIINQLPLNNVSSNISFCIHNLLLDHYYLLLMDTLGDIYIYLENHKAFDIQRENSVGSPLMPILYAEEFYGKCIKYYRSIDFSNIKLEDLSDTLQFSGLGSNSVLGAYIISFNKPVRPIYSFTETHENHVKLFKHSKVFCQGIEFNEKVNSHSVSNFETYDYLINNLDSTELFLNKVVLVNLGNYFYIVQNHFNNVTAITDGSPGVIKVSNNYSAVGVNYIYNNQIYCNIIPERNDIFRTKEYNNNENTIRLAKGLWNKYSLVTMMSKAINKFTYNGGPGGILEKDPHVYNPSVNCVELTIDCSSYADSYFYIIESNFTDCLLLRDITKHTTPQGIFKWDISNSENYAVYYSESQLVSHKILNIDDTNNITFDVVLTESFSESNKVNKITVDNNTYTVQFSKPLRFINSISDTSAVYYARGLEYNEDYCTIEFLQDESNTIEFNFEHYLNYNGTKVPEESLHKFNDYNYVYNSELITRVHAEHLKINGNLLLLPAGFLTVPQFTEKYQAALRKTLGNPELFIERYGHWYYYMNVTSNFKVTTEDTTVSNSNVINSLINMNITNGHHKRFDNIKLSNSKRFLFGYNANRNFKYSEIFDIPWDDPLFKFNVNQALNTVDRENHLKSLQFYEDRFEFTFEIPFVFCYTNIYSYDFLENYPTATDRTNYLKNTFGNGKNAEYYVNGIEYSENYRNLVLTCPGSIKNKDTFTTTFTMYSPRYYITENNVAIYDTINNEFMKPVEMINQNVFIYNKKAYFICNDTDSTCINANYNNTADHSYRCYVGKGVFDLTHLVYKLLFVANKHYTVSNNNYLIGKHDFYCSKVLYNPLRVILTLARANAAEDHGSVCLSVTYVSDNLKFLFSANWTPFWDYTFNCVELFKTIDNETNKVNSEITLENQDILFDNYYQLITDTLTANSIDYSIYNNYYFYHDVNSKTIDIETRDIFIKIDDNVINITETFNDHSQLVVNDVTINHSTGKLSANSSKLIEFRFCENGIETLGFGGNYYTPENSIELEYDTPITSNRPNYKNYYFDNFPLRINGEIIPITFPFEYSCCIHAIADLIQIYTSVYQDNTTYVVGNRVFIEGDPYIYYNDTDFNRIDIVQHRSVGHWFSTSNNTLIHWDNCKPDLFDNTLQQLTQEFTGYAYNSTGVTPTDIKVNSVEEINDSINGHEYTYYKLTFNQPVRAVHGHCLTKAKHLEHFKTATYVNNSVARHLFKSNYSFVDVANNFNNVVKYFPFNVNCINDNCLTKDIFHEPSEETIVIGVDDYFIPECNFYSTKYTHDFIYDDHYFCIINSKNNRIDYKISSNNDSDLTTYLSHSCVTRKQLLYDLYSILSIRDIHRNNNKAENFTVKIYDYNLNGFNSGIPFGLIVVNNRTLSAFTNGIGDNLKQCAKNKKYNMTPDVSTALGYNILLRLENTRGNIKIILPNETFTMKMSVIYNLLGDWHTSGASPAHPTLPSDFAVTDFKETEDYYEIFFNYPVMLTKSCKISETIDNELFLSELNNGSDIMCGLEFTEELHRATFRNIYRRGEYPSEYYKNNIRFYKNHIIGFIRHSDQEFIPLYNKQTNKYIYSSDYPIIKINDYNYIIDNEHYYYFDNTSLNFNNKTTDIIHHGLFNLQDSMENLIIAGARVVWGNSCIHKKQFAAVITIDKIDREHSQVTLYYPNVNREVVIKDSEIINKIPELFENYLIAQNNQWKQEVTFIVNDHVPETSELLKQLTIQNDTVIVDNEHYIQFDNNPLKVSVFFNKFKVN